MEETGPTGTNQRQCLFGLWNDETGVAGAASPRGHGILFTLFPFSRGSSQSRRSARLKVVAQSELWPMWRGSDWNDIDVQLNGKMTFKFGLILRGFLETESIRLSELNRFCLDKFGLLVLDLTERYINRIHV